MLAAQNSVNICSLLQKLCANQHTPAPGYRLSLAYCKRFILPHAVSADWRASAEGVKVLSFVECGDTVDVRKQWFYLTSSE